MVWMGGWEDAGEFVNCRYGLFWVLSAMRAGGGALSYQRVFFTRLFDILKMKTEEIP